jgi:APA family basic amino acid/polyamine antiporter
VYLREAFGSRAAFLSGWTSFIAGFSGAIAASAVGFAIYTARIVPWFSGAAFQGPFGISVQRTTLLALVTIVVFTAVAARGLSLARVATNVLAVAVIAGMVAMMIGGVSLDAPEPAVMSGTASFVGVLAALVPVMFTYSGWNAAAYVTPSFVDPEKTLPRALIAGTLIVIVLYVGINAAYLRALSAPGLIATEAAGEATAALVLGDTGRVLMTLLIMAALADSVCAMVVTGPQIYLQMARDHAMPAFFARVRERDGLPLGSLIAQSAWSCVLVMTGTFDAIITYTGVAVVLFGGAAVASIFVFRKRFGSAGAGFRVWGYPVVPAAFVAMTVVMLVATVMRQPGPSLAGLALVAAGVPLHSYLAFRNRNGLLSKATSKE